MCTIPRSWLRTVRWLESLLPSPPFSKGDGFVFVTIFFLVFRIFLLLILIIFLSLDSAWSHLSKNTKMARITLVRPSKSGKSVYFEFPQLPSPLPRGMVIVFVAICCFSTLLKLRNWDSVFRTSVKLTNSTGSAALPYAKRFSKKERIKDIQRIIKGI